MRSSIRKMGNSSAILIPKPLLLEIGAKAGDEVELGIEKGRLVIEAVRPHPRAGWADDARHVAATDHQDLVLDGFGNAGDDDLIW